MASLKSFNHVNIAALKSINHVNISDAVSFNHVTIESAVSKVLTFQASYSFFWEYFEYGSGSAERAYITITPDATFSTTQPSGFTRIESQASNFIDIYPTAVNSTYLSLYGTSTLSASGYTCTGDCTVSLEQGPNEASSSHGSSMPTCLIGDSLITMSNGKKKKIADLKPGDKILAIDFKNMELVENTVGKIVKTPHNRLVKIKWNGGEITSTTDHPFFEKTKRWSSFRAGMTNKYYPEIPNHCQRLQVGDKIFTVNDFKTIESTIFINQTISTWQIMSAEYDTYFANDLLTLIEKR